MSDRYTVHPWRHTQDLLSTRTALYHPSTPSDRAAALSLIRAWKLRGSLPHAIDSTAALLEAQLFHARIAGTIPADEASFPLRATYMAALGRFVTGFADIGRHRTGPARSMAEIAKDIALPASFVEVRHEAAHEDLPSLPRLVGLVEEALGWLWGAYWARLDEGGKADRGEVGREEWRGVLRKYRKARVKGLQNGAGIVETEALVEATTEEIMALAEGSKEGYPQLAESLCTPGMLIPVAATTAESDDRMKTAVELWHPLLLNLAQRSRRMMKPFLVALTRRTPEQGALGLEHRGLLQWLQQICSDSDWDRALGLRLAPLLSYTLKARLLDTYCNQDACKVVCEFLLTRMRSIDGADQALWESMYAARFGAGTDTAEV